jgi:hypothetical protein
MAVVETNILLTDQQRYLIYSKFLGLKILIAWYLINWSIKLN